MRVSDIFKISLLYNSRRRKKAYSFIILICCILSIVILIFTSNIIKIINTSISQNIGFRTIVVITENNDQEKIKQIMKMDNVIDVYPSENSKIKLEIESFLNKKINGGYVTIKRSTDGTLPFIVKISGKINNKRNYAICPSKFYPYDDVGKIDKNKIISGNEIIGSTFKLRYYDYKFDKNKRPTISNSYFKEFEIIGLYDNSKTMDDSGTCYVNYTELDDIINTTLTLRNENKNYNNGNVSVSIETSIDVVVDESSNVNSVIDNLNKTGHQVVGLNSSLDVGLIKIIYTSVIVVMFITIFSLTFVSVSFIKKKFLTEETNIGLSKILGYCKRDLISIYSLETFICNLIIYILGSLIALTFSYIFKNTHPNLISIDLMIGGITIGFIPFAVTFLLIVIIPTIISIFILNKGLEENVKLLLFNGE